MRRRVIDACLSLGIGALARRMTHDIPRIFLLHRFSQTPKPGCMNAEAFAAFLDKLSGYCQLVRMEEIPWHLAKAGRRKAIAAITVDDGYADFHAVALPILAQRRIPATLYVTAGFISGQCWLWWDAVRYLLDACKIPELRIDIDGQCLRFGLFNDADRRHAWSALGNALLKSNRYRELVIADLERQAGLRLPAAPAEGYRPMTWEDLRECQQNGIEIGAHSLTHAFLPELSPEHLQSELAGAKSLLESQLGAAVTTFAYPNGMSYDWSPTVERAVQACGYKSAVLAYPLPFDPNHPFRLGRWSTGPSDGRLGMVASGLDALRLGWRSRPLTAD